MDNFSVRSERNFHNLVVKPNHMHLLDKPNGYASAMIKSSLSHQMRFTVQVLEEELCAAGSPHVLQIKLLGDDSREPSSWKLFADGACVADGSGAFARECFCEGAEVFLNLCRDAVRAAELRQWSQREYELLSAARGIAGGVGRQTRQLVILVDASIQTAGQSRAYSAAMPNRMAFSKGLPPPPSALTAGRPARGACWKGAPELARPSPTVGGLPGRADSHGSPRPSSA